ncbi:MAG: DedA family protein [Gallionella sp.]|nr:DedA family protein [Gallionella sp.]
MSETASLWSLFISSFLAATLLPGGSEAVLFGVLKAYPETLWIALGLATIGNTLGGMVSFGMGWLLPQTQQLKHVEKLRPRHGGAELSGAGVAASHLLPQTAGFASNVSKVRRHGTPALLLAWVPLLGDALCLAAGWLRLNPWQAALFMAMGKFARYWVIALAMV